MKRFKAAVVGAGFIGVVHCEAIRRLGNVELAALCDAAGCSTKAEALGIPAAYTDYRAMIDEIRPDAIHICTPNFTHYEIAKYALKRGVHIVCEKPFTTTVEQAEELVALAKAEGLYGAVNFHNRLYPMTNELHEMAQAGELGRIYTIHGAYMQDWLLYDTDYSWRLEREQAGSTRAVADIGSHWIDLAEFVTGERITAVTAQFLTVHPTRKKPLGKVETFSGGSGQSEYEKIAIDTEDAAVVSFETSNGAIGSVVVSQVFAGKKNSMTLCVAGSEKSAVWDSEAVNDLYIGYREKANEMLTKNAALMHSGAARLASYPGGHAEGFPDAFKNVFRQFYQSLNEDDEYSYATLADGLREMRLCEAIFDSAKQQCRIEIGQGGG